MNARRFPVTGLVVALALALLLAVMLAASQAASPSWIAMGERAHSNFGYSVGTAGDVNGDGLDDVVVGADRYKDFTGRVYVYAGSVDGLGSNAILTVTGETANNHFGYSVGTAGDVNGDGYDDVIVGAYHYSNFLGRTYVYAGNATGVSADPVFVAKGENENIYFGRSAGAAGDVNGDGYADIVVGAPAYDDWTGRVYVFAGSANGPGGRPIFTATGEGLSSAFGRSVGTAGDVNGDGYDDVIVGARGHAGAGQVYVYAGSAAGLEAVPIFTAAGEARGDNFGCAVGTAGDVNGDGFKDVIVGADGHDGHTGRIYVYAGGAEGLSATSIFAAAGEDAHHYFGGSVSTAGDVNGDGFDDIVVGANGYRTYTGRAYLYAGGAGTLQVTPILTITGEAMETWLGKSVGGAGDVNGDGVADVIVGAYGYGDWMGQAYVFHGVASQGQGLGRHSVQVAVYVAAVGGFLVFGSTVLAIVLRRRGQGLGQRRNV